MNGRLLLVMFEESPILLSGLLLLLGGRLFHNYTSRPYLNAPSNPERQHEPSAERLSVSGALKRGSL